MRLDRLFIPPTAAFGAGSSPLRAWSFSFDEIARTITFRAEVDTEVIVEDDNCEDLSLAGGEASADLLLGEGTQVNMEILLVPSDQPLDPLPDGVVFLRAGEWVPDNYGGATPHPRSTAYLTRISLRTVNEPLCRRFGSFGRIAIHVPHRRRVGRCSVVAVLAAEP